MTAAVWTRKLRVAMYTGLGRPVDPEVKFTKPGQARNRTAPAAAGRSSGSANVLRPAAAPAANRALRPGGTNTGVLAGKDGELRQARASAGKMATGRDRLDRAKKSATACG